MTQICFGVAYLVLAIALVYVPLKLRSIHRGSS